MDSENVGNGELKKVSSQDRIKMDGIKIIEIL